MTPSEIRLKILERRDAWVAVADPKADPYLLQVKLQKLYVQLMCEHELHIYYTGGALLGEWCLKCGFMYRLDDPT